MMKLREQAIFQTIKLDEQTAPGITNLRFRFLTTGVPTGNGNLYKAGVMKKAVEDFNRRLKERGPILGSDDHLKGTPEVSDISHMLTKLWMEGDDVWAEAKVLPTTRGHDLGVIIKNGGRIGVSARGRGTAKETEKGKEVQDDYILDSIDFVLNPSTGNYVGEESIFEGMELDEEQEDSMYQRFAFACSPEGGSFRGSFASYKEAHRATAQPKGQDAAQEAYQDACRRAGFKGTFADFRKVMGGLKETLTEGAAEERVTPGKGLSHEEGDITLEEEAKFTQALDEAIKKVYQEKFSVEGWDDEYVFCFDMDRSETAAIPFLIDKNGCVQLTAPPRIIDEI